MRNIFSNKFNNLFFAGIVSVVLTFFYLRPLNSPWHPFIAGDGLGYYSYLPAKFIHNDPDLDFKWFNKVYNQNYVYSTFDNPEDNLLVQYKDKKINKYYQGLSFIWMPFFVAAHVFAKLFNYAPDGFSKPYQYAIGLASLVYLLLGLYCLRKLILRVVKNQWIAVIVPFLIFFGTHLFNYSIFANSLSHAYSFTFIICFLYFVQRFFQEPGKKSQSLLLIFFFLAITVSIRPLNGLILFTVPAFIPAGFQVKRVPFERLRFFHFLILFLTLFCITYHLRLTYIQTGSIIAYTYTDEKFDFRNNRFFDALFSYHMGLFVYVPMIVLSLFGVVKLNRKMTIIFLLFFFGIIFLYSAWWYWPITKRAVIDYYGIPAIFLSGFLMSLKNVKQRWLAGIMLFLAVVYYQLKFYQMQNGILDEYLTYKEVYWRDFFRIKKNNVFLIPPQSILEKTEHLEDFESQNNNCKISRAYKYRGGSSMVLDKNNSICTIGESPYPSFLQNEGVKKVRFSFQLYAETGVKQVHAFINFLDMNGQLILEMPFYINADYLQQKRWDYKEFGYEIVDHKVLNDKTVGKVLFKVWNVDAVEPVYIDDAKLEFILTDRSFETLK